MITLSRCFVEKWGRYRKWRKDQGKLVKFISFDSLKNMLGFLVGACLWQVPAEFGVVVRKLSSPAVCRSWLSSSESAGVEPHSDQVQFYFNSYYRIRFLPHYSTRDMSISSTQRSLAYGDGRNKVKQGCYLQTNKYIFCYEIFTIHVYFVRRTTSDNSFVWVLPNSICTTPHEISSSPLSSEWGTLWNHSHRIAELDVSRNTRCFVTFIRFGSIK